MTYLEIVNEVLNRLREEQISSALLDSNPYYRSIGAFVNDAKRYVEEAWSWSCFRQTDTVALVEGVKTTELPFSGDGTDYEIQSVYASNTPNLSYVRRVAYPKIREQYFSNAINNGQPREYAVRGRNSTTGNIEITMVPPPSSEWSLEIDCVRKQPPLTEFNDVLLVPSLPVYLMATALAAEERGEVGGSSSSTLLARANQALANAIQYDTAFFEEELVWTGGISRPYNTNIRNY